MLFNSIEYLFFLVSVFFVFWFLLRNHLKLQNFFLLAANYLFYGWWDWRFLFLIIFISGVNYFSSIQIGKIDPDSAGLRRKLFLVVSVFINLSVLGIFKYFDFFSQSASLLLNTIGFKTNPLTFDIILPIGISFYILQTLSYTIDVYNTKIEPKRDIISFFAYISFFPLILAGPIERASNLITQFLKKKEFNYEKATEGLRQILWGLFKKVVIADRLAILVNQVYNNTGNYEGVPLVLATYFFAIQIYCDFSGYSDIAIGSAKLLGFNLMRNFRTPYYSKDIVEFWRRWHISLSTWLRDYLFVPLNLQFRYLNKLGTLLTVMITFLVCGLWHGASWTYIIWGAIHGFYIVFAILTFNIFTKAYKLLHLNEGSLIRKFVDVFITFHLVAFAWIFFRANSLNDAIYIITHLFPLNISEFIAMLSSTGATQASLGLTKRGIILALLSISIMEIMHLFGQNEKNRIFLNDKYTIVRWVAYYALIIAIISFGEFNMKEFIYFQF